MRQKLIEIIKYGFWGVVSTSVNLLLFAFLDYLDIMHYLVANGIAYAVAVVINYICNKLFVFTAPDQTVKGKTETAVQFVKFIIMYRSELTHFCFTLSSTNWAFRNCRGA